MDALGRVAADDFEGGDAEAAAAMDTGEGVIRVGLLAFCALHVRNHAGFL
jgi:hypothetical protein